MQDTSIYKKYFCKGKITTRDVADYIAQWLPDHQRLLRNVNRNSSPLEREQDGAAKRDIVAGIEDNKRVIAKLYSNDPLNPDDVREVLIYLESAQKAMHELLIDEDVVGLDKFIDELRSESGKS
ncbi:MAG: hypothetical protein WC988_03090 [Patescibacteria group bacterium]